MTEPEDITQSTLYPLHKVSFMDSRDPTRNHTALFNPESMTVTTAARIGRLNPIGWSQSIKQYAGADDTKFSLELHYSLVAYIEREPVRLQFLYPYKFFQSFIYGPKPGIAPSFLVVNFPKTLRMTCTLESVSVNFQRWQPSDMKVRAYNVTLELSEVATSFLSSGDVEGEGFYRAERRIHNSTDFGSTQPSTQTGTSMRIKGRMSV